MTTRVSIRYGGTGANTAEGARQALDVLSTSGGSFSGSLNVGSNLTVSSVLTANNRGIFGSGFNEHAAAKDIDVNSIVFGGIKNDNGPAEAMVINKSNGAVAYAEFIALNDTANQEQGWISIGVNSSGYNDPEYTLTGPDDGYLLFEAPEGTTANGDLIIGTGSYGQNNRIVLAAGGFEPQDAQLVIAPAELKTAEIVNSSLNSNIAILTTANTHTFIANDLVVISSVGAPYNGTRTIIDVTSNTFNLSITSANIASAVVDPPGSAVESLPFNNGTVELTAQLYVGEDSKNTIVNADITLIQGHAIPLGVVVNNDGPGQVVMVNKSNGALAYTEYIAHNDVGNVEMGWVSFGINSSGYDDPEYPITKADDAYLLYEPPANTTGDGDFIIGTGTNGTKNRLIFAAEGFDESNAQMIITPNESVRIAIDTDASSVNTGALQVVGGVGVQGSMYVQGNQTIQGDLIVNGSQIIQSIENLAAAGPISLLSDGNIANTWDQGLVGTYAVSKSSVTEDIEFKELANNSATLSTSNNHSFVVEDIVAVANVDATFDGTHRITGVTANTFSFYKLANNVSKVSATGTATVDKATRYTGFAKRASDGVWRLFSNLGTRPEFNTNFNDANLVYDAITAGAGDFRGTLKLGTPNTATISYTDANNRTLTIPALGGDRTFAFLDQAQTFTAAQGFNNTVTATKFIPTGGDATGNGLYLPSANKLAFSADGVERASMSASEMVVNDGSNDYDFRVESDGVAHMLFVDGGTNTVGIGTNIPAANLHVQGNTYISGSVGIGTTNPSNKLDIFGGKLTITADASNEQFVIARQTNTAEQLILGFHSSDYAQISAVEQNVAFRPLALNPNGGNVGIGTTNPTARLHVTDTNTFHVIPNYNGSPGIPAGIIVGSANAANLTFYADGSSGTVNRGVNISAFSGIQWYRGLSYQNKSGVPDLILQQDGGNVGIGTTTSLQKLSVAGSAAGGTIGIEVRNTDGVTTANNTAALYLSATGSVPNGSVIKAIFTGTPLVNHAQAITFNPVNAGSVPFEALRIDSSGAVGIGTTSPGASLEVSAATTNGVVRLGQLQYKNSSGAYGQSANGVHIFPFSDGILYHDNFNGGFAWRTGTGSTERMRINSAGDVGIGISPSFSLDVYRSNTTTSVVAARNDTSTTLMYATSSSSFAGTTTNTAFGFITNNTERMRIDSSGNVNIGGTANYGGLLSINRAQSGSPSLARMLTMRDASSGSLMELNFFGDPTFGTASRFDFTGAYLAFTVNGTNRMRIMTGGNVGIGIDNPADLLHVNGTARSKFVYALADSADDSANFGNTQSNLRIGGDGAQMRINVAPWGLNIITGTAGLRCANVYSTTVGGTNRDVFVDDGGIIGYVSSIRESKTNINEIIEISWLKQLTPVSFNYRKKDEEGKYTDETDGGIEYGLIAEDVEPIAPELCFYDIIDGEQHLRGISYSKLITPMLKYIQQLEERIEALENK